MPGRSLETYNMALEMYEDIDTYLVRNTETSAEKLYALLALRAAMNERIKGLGFEAQAEEDGMVGVTDAR